MRSVLSVSLLLLLAACGVETTQTPPAAQTVAPEATAEPLAQTTKQPAESILPDAGLLENHTPRAVQTALGEPSLVRRDDTVQVMLFERPSCVLEVIFYEKDPNDHFKVTDINARSVRGMTLDRDKCLAAILGNGVSLDLPSP